MIIVTLLRITILYIVIAAMLLKYNNSKLLSIITVVII